MPPSTSVEHLRRDAPEIRPLTGIRIVAALWVVFAHAGLWLPTLVPEVAVLDPLTRGGFAAVDLFFVLSGFILSYQYFGRLRTPRDYRDFMVRRLARIYPLHLFMLLIFGGIVLVTSALAIPMGSAGQFTLGGFFSDLLLVRAWWGDALVWNIPAWSISAEWFAYILFPALALVAVWAAKRRFGLWGVCAALLTVAGVSAALWPSLNNMPVPTIRVAVGFLVGVCVQRLVRNARPSRLAAYLGLLSSGALVVVSGIGQDDPLVRGLQAGAIVALCGVTIALLSIARGPAVAWLGSTVVEYGGRLAFSIYLVHLLGLMVVGQVLTAERFGGESLLVRLSLVMAALIVLFIVSAALHELIEKPGRRLVLRVAAKVLPSSGGHHGARRQPRKLSPSTPSLRSPR
ncbi:MAG TPA: acyltransferase [Plantibacter sp.]|uniref:acyltransferase family protein n=1 Tax=unclassified Plantibacter TaxID=2624265 RepID=UPI002C018947|nr:acyltransferase [Plantibacter sp.]